MRFASCLKVVSAAVVLVGAGVFLSASADVTGDQGDWVVTGNQVVGAEGVTCSSITFNANATISGGPITLGAGGIYVASGVTAAVIESEIAGDANFSVCGAGFSTATANQPNSVISFKGANTFTGEMTISNILFRAYNDLSFGSKENKTKFYSTPTTGKSAQHGEIWFHGIDTEEPFETYYGGSPVRQFCFAAKSENVLRGLVRRVNDGRVYFYAEDQAKAVLSNKWQSIGYNSEVAGAAGTASYDVWGPFTGIQRINFIQGTWNFHERVGSFDSGKYGSQINANGTLISSVTNLFALSDTAAAAYKVHLWGAGKWDLNGYDQRVDEFCKYYPGESDKATTFTVTSEKPATLRCDNTTRDQLYDGRITGKVRFVLEGSKKLTMSAASTTIGDLVVTNTAVLEFGSAASWAGTNIYVESGAQLTVVAAANLPEYAKIHLAPSGRLNLSAALSVKEYWQNNVRMANNSYGSSQSSANVKDDEHFSGTGVLVVLSEAITESVWVGGTDGDLLTTEANWEMAPDLTTGLAKVKFAKSGVRAVVPAEDTLFRMGNIFFATPNSSPCFGFVPAGAASRISVSSLTADAADSTARNYTNDVPTSLEAAQSWDLPSSATTFYQNAPLSSPVAVNWTKSGKGALHLTRPAGTLTGKFHVENGNVHLVEPRALGTMDIEHDYQPAPNARRFYFYGGVVSNKFTITGGPDSSDAIVFKEKTTTEFANLFNYNGHYDRSTHGSNSKIIFSGGVTNCSGYRSWVGHYVFTNKPCSFGAFSNHMGLLEIWTTGNRYGLYGGSESFFFSGGSSRIELHAPYAVNTNTVNNNGKYVLVPFITAVSDTVFDVCGCEQQFGHMEEYENPPMLSDQNWTITSAKPAQVKFYQDADKTVSHLLVTGAAGLTLNGPKALTLTSRTCTTTGALEVENGTLTLGAGERFPKLSAVRVSGGTFAVTAANQLNRRVDLSVSGAGQVSVPSGVTLEVRRLYVNGESQPLGDYTGGFITGGGRIHVPGGVAIILK